MVRLLPRVPTSVPQVNTLNHIMVDVYIINKFVKTTNNDATIHIGRCG